MSNVLAIKTEHLIKAFGGYEVIRDCNLNVETGAIYGFLGANGAGKTTVFKLLSGLLKPTMGTVAVLEMDVQYQRDSVLKNIGMLTETPVFFEHLSATENLAIHLEYMEEKKQTLWVHYRVSD